MLSEALCHLLRSDRYLIISSSPSESRSLLKIWRTHKDTAWNCHRCHKCHSFSGCETGWDGKWDWKRLTKLLEKSHSTVIQASKDSRVSMASAWCQLCFYSMVHVITTATVANPLPSCWRHGYWCTTWQSQGKTQSNLLSTFHEFFSMSRKKEWS